MKKYLKLYSWQPRSPEINLSQMDALASIAFCGTSASEVKKVKLCPNQVKFFFSFPFYVSCSTHQSLRHNYAAVSCSCLEGTDATATARDRGFKWSLPQELSKVFVSPSKSCSHCSRCQNRQKRTLKFCEFGGWIPQGGVIRNLSNSLQH